MKRTCNIPLRGIYCHCNQEGVHTMEEERMLLS